MLTGAALGKAISLLMPIPFNGNYARRVALSSLFGISGLPTPRPAQIQVQVPTFLRCSNREYRFNPPGVLNLYLGESESTAAAETKQHPGLKGFAFEPATPDAVFHVEVKVGAILDLTSADVLSALKTSSDELTANWRLASPKAPTQLLGGAVFDCNRFEGIRYQSAPMKKSGADGYCLVLFRDRKQPSSIVKLFDPNGIWTESW